MTNQIDAAKEQLKDQARELKSQGKTNTEISKILNVPRKTIYNWIGNSLNLPKSGASTNFRHLLFLIL